MVQCSNRDCAYPPWDKPPSQPPIHIPDRNHVRLPPGLTKGQYLLPVTPDKACKTDNFCFFKLEASKQIRNPLSVRGHPLSSKHKLLKPRDGAIRLRSFFINPKWWEGSRKLAPIIRKVQVSDTTFVSEAICHPFPNPGNYFPVMSRDEL
jgi:hypothetical protein